jgi:ABC-type nitrate/sulfonate/bicarbonate transport system permease component
MPTIQRKGQCNGRAQNSFVRVLHSISPVVLLLLCWEAGSWALGPSRLPSPFESLRLMVLSSISNPIIETQGGGSMGYAPHVFSTFWHVALGCTLGFGFGLATALLMAQNKLCLLVGNMLLELTRSVPPLIFVPFITIILGPTDLVQILSVAVYSTLTVALYSLNAISILPSEYLILAELLGANRTRRILTIQLPGILPQLLGAVRLIFSLGLGISIVAEYLVSPSGIGRVMKYSMAYSNAGLIVVGVLWTIMLAFLFDLVTVSLFAVSVRWTERGQLVKFLAAEPSFVEGISA